VSAGAFVQHDSSFRASERANSGIDSALLVQFDVDVDPMLETAHRITYLCTPNNPTGGALPRRLVEQIVRMRGGW